MGSGGGSQTTTTVDPAYNAGMLKLSQEQQGWASDMFNMFKYGVDYDPTAQTTGKMIDGKWVEAKDLTPDVTGGEQWIDNPKYKPGGWVDQVDQETNQTRKVWVDGSGENVPQKILNPNYSLETKTYGDIYGYDPSKQTSEMQYLQNLVESNQGLLGLQTDVNKAQLESQKTLLPLSTDVARMGLEGQKELMPLQTGVQKQKLGLASTFLNDVNKGINVNERMDQAEAGVEHGFKEAEKVNQMGLQSFGLDPSSGRYASQNRAAGLSLATGIAGARTGAKTQAEEDDFQRKLKGLSINY